MAVLQKGCQLLFSRGIPMGCRMGACDIFPWFSLVAHKGQLISKANFQVVDSPKKKNKRRLTLLHMSHKGKPGENVTCAHPATHGIPRKNKS